jgi:hypothetical protein
MTLSVDVMATAYSYEILDAIEVTRLHQCSAARCVDAPDIEAQAKYRRA